MGGQNKIDNTEGNLLKSTVNNALSNFEGIFSVKPMAKYLSGARCVLRANGNIIGFAFAISWKISTDAVEINTIDDYMPYELAPSRISVTGTISGFRIPGSGPGNLNLQANVESFLHQKYIEIEVRDSQTDNVIFLTRKALITDRSENIKSESLSEMTLNFTAIGFMDEVLPELPSGAAKIINPRMDTVDI